jgi:hypothetical protein
MANTFESRRGNSDEYEIIPDNFEFKSAGKKYINQNYKDIGLVLGIEGEWLGNIKRQANSENKLPDIQGELSLEQINFYRGHYDFPPLTQDEYDSIKAQNTSTEVTIDEQSEEVLTEVQQPPIDLEKKEFPTSESNMQADFRSSVIIDIPDNASTKLSSNNVQSTAQSLYYWGNAGFAEGAGPIKSLEHAIDLVEGKGRLLWPEKIAGINDDAARNDRTIGRISPDVEAMTAAYLQFYGVTEPAIEVERAEMQSDEADTIKRQTIDTEADTTKVSEGQDESPSLKGENLADVSKAEVTDQTNPDLDELQSELSRLVTEAANKLNIEQEQENNQEYSSRLDREKIERFTENARQAIQSYQEFANEHSSPFDNSNAQIQERYRQLEKIAWNSLYNLAHALDGEIATLPTDRDIQLSHPGGVDTKQYLESRGYEFNEDGDITCITDKGVKIELNRAMKTDYLIKSRRPSHIVYDKSISLDSDGDYHGYLVRGLNKHTPEFVLGVLDKDHLESVIVDETQQLQNEVSNANEFNPLQQSQIDRGKEAGFTDEEISRYAKTEYDEIKMRDIFNQILEDRKLSNAVVDKEPESNNRSELGETTPQGSLEDLRLAYARAEEAWNRDTKNRDLENEFDKARDAYNDELERVLKLQVAQGQEANIHELFKNEVTSLREERITQSQELQGTWEKRLNPLKEKFVNFVIKHKKLMGRVNLGLGIAGGALALTGVGIPLAGGLAVTRRAISGVLLGVSSGEGVRSLGEDADINLAWGKIKFQAVIPKLVKESLASSEDEFKKVSDNELKDRLGTLEAYYRLNGGKFTNNDQQKAYEKILIELGHRVRVNTLENYQNTQESSSEQTQDISANQDGLQESVDTSSQDNNSTEVVNSSNTETFNFGESRYTSELLNTISDKRVQELDEFRRKRKIATVTGIGVGLLVGGAVHVVDEINKPDSLDAPESGGIRPNIPDAGEGNVPTPEPISPNPSETPGTGGLGEPPSAPDAPLTGAGEALSQSEQLAQSAEVTRAAAEQAAQQAAEQAAEQLAQDVSSLDPGETIWGEVAKQLGENATDAQIQQAVENLLQSAEGQDSIYKLAQGTEGGRALLAQWGIDNATEMAELSKEQLYEISRYLAPGELQGITELSLENLTPFEAVEPPQVDVSDAMGTPDTPVAEAPTPSVEPTPSATPGSTPAPEAPPITSTEFTRGLSEALGTTNLTEIQVGNILEAYIENPQNKESLYYLILDSQQNNPDLTNLLMEYRVSDIDKFVELSPDRMYKLAELVGVENLDKLPGFELNDIILSKFEDAPDTVELIRGSRPLDVVNQYISNELGNLPYDSTLGQQVLNTYINTPAGKEWLYESIVSNPNPDNQNVQMFREYLSFKGIKSAEEFKQTFDWAEFSGNKRIPTSAFWNYTRLPNGNMRIAPLSTFLQPGKMVGIPEAIRQVLTKQ